MSALVQPPRLCPGDVVAVATPSGSVAVDRRLRRGVEALRARGYRVEVGPLAGRPGGASGRVERVTELNGFLRDPRVRCVVMSMGGLTSNAVLDHLDYEALREDPKIIVGYSDITAILLAVLRHTSIVTFHGPTLLPELAEYPEVLPYTWDHFARAVGRPEPLGPLTAAPRWTEELLWWDRADDRDRVTRPSEGWRPLHGGAATGPLIGGNLETIGLLGGTGHLPDFTGALVLLESTATDLQQVERSLTQLEMLGVFDRMAGLLVGRSFRGAEGFEEQFTSLVAERFAHHGVPVLAGVDLGHTDPMLTLPLGVRARLDGDAGTIEVLDAAVR
ncbi:muramoyltetrapeptide carboxypeptidase LdcA involved in peptidoglycan recycling [Streptomyces sp. TLI_235]|nr:S66 peptidase family protein [Streptomyces sp. TLI_235]PBC66230.1 muramoyltetrapeptide carboxypeptidase LdcA involved in peptidoglycan recycling [Streptomyces sp. TLI_235]